MGNAQGYTVLIDGYNVMKRHPRLALLTLREARQQLIALLRRTRWPVPSPHLVVVFDGQRTHGLPPLADAGGGTRGPHASRQVEVCFATPSADAYIQQRIRVSRAPRRLLILSDDGEILRTAKSHGTQRYSSRWFFQRQAPTTRPLHDATADHPTLSASAARRITEALAKRWLAP